MECLDTPKMGMRLLSDDGAAQASCFAEAQRDKSKSLVN